MAAAEVLIANVFKGPEGTTDTFLCDWEVPAGVKGNDLHQEHLEDWIFQHILVGHQSIMTF